jgi:hypothetical protein
MIKNIIEATLALVFDFIVAYGVIYICYWCFDKLFTIKAAVGWFIIWKCISTMIEVAVSHRMEREE